MAAIGGVSAGLGLVHRRELTVPSNVLSTFIFAGIISLIGLISIVYNGTTDTSYARYIVSLAVWLSAAFGVCSIIKIVHRDVNASLCCNYLIAVSVAQCILALIIDNSIAFKGFVNTYIQQGQVLLDEMDRMYGIGASLDVAGSRFAACITMAVYMLFNKKENASYSILYMVSILIIGIVGNMIARTTSVGLIVALGYIAYNVIVNGYKLEIRIDAVKKTMLFSLLVLAVVLFAVQQYNTNAVFRGHMRFAFEGFFSLAETGEWNVSSNEKLKTMVVFPETLKTWIIGDGYFNNPRGDINYVGETTTEGFYMGTDIGYLRFIFYFGLIGLVAFCAFIAQMTFACSKKAPQMTALFFMVAICNYVVWIKVSTDLVLILCILLCATDMAEGRINDDKGLIENKPHEQP